MKNLLLLIASVFIIQSSRATVVPVSNIGQTFSPSAIIISFGDSVNFSLGLAHNVVEVSQSTWNANGNTPLPGGFSLPFGGGLLIPAQLPVGLHYYVCDPHADDGMKGTITVQSATGITNISESSSFIKLSPVPAASKIFIAAPGVDLIDMHNLIGKKIGTIRMKHENQPKELNISELENGIYFFSFIKEGRVVETRKIIKE